MRSGEPSSTRIAEHTTLKAMALSGHAVPVLLLEPARQLPVLGRLVQRPAARP